MALNLFNLKNVLILFLCLFFYQTKAQQRFDKSAEELAKIKILKARVEANPADVKLHEAFADLFIGEDLALEAQYEIWMAKYPNNYVIPFTLGKALEGRESLKATPYLLRASVLKPDNAEVWSLLAQDAGMTNNVTNQNIYLQKAATLSPKNAKYVFDYAYSFLDSNPEKYDSLSLDIARKFPDDEVGVKALSLLAQKTTVPQEKIAYLKQIFNRKSNHKSDWYVGAMEYYFDMLLKTDPAQAFELGTAIILDNNLYLDLWHERLIVADAFIRSRSLLNEGKPQEATALLNQVKLRNNLLGRVIDVEEYLTLYKAEALDSAKMFRAAFDTIATYDSKKPNESLQPSLFKYGKQNSMDTFAVNQNIASIRNSAAKKATDFVLKNYKDGSNTSLADYAGKVVLVTYWFPGCGPCKAEFPHFENALKNFDKTEVGYLALNIEPSQNDAVLPLLKQTGYSFTALRDSMSRMKGNLDNGNSAPVNFLIDKKGRIAFSHFRIDADNEKTLELMIKETLAEKD